MLFFISLLPATALATIGYFVLFSTQWAEGALRSFGRILGSWFLVIATAVVLGGLTASLVGWNPMDAIMAGFAEHMEQMDRMVELGEEQLSVLRGLQQN